MSPITNLLIDKDVSFEQFLIGFTVENVIHNYVILVNNKIQAFVQNNIRKNNLLYKTSILSSLLAFVFAYGNKSLSTICCTYSSLVCFNLHVQHSHRNALEEYDYMENPLKPVHKTLFPKTVFL